MNIELWGQIFKDFRQVREVSIDSSIQQLDIIIEEHKDILHASTKELNESLHEFSSNPHEVVTSFLKKHGILVYYQNTLVGFFDIQAYSAFVEQMSMEEAVRRINYSLQTIKSMATTKALAVKFDHWILSDSIIVVVDTNRHPLFTGSLSWFLQTCSMIMRSSMMNGFPLRGAIGGGDFYKDGEIMVSSGLIDAAKYEREQDWFGALLTPKALQIIENAKQYEITHKGKTNIDLSSGDFNSFVRYGVIPWKATSKYAKKADSRQMYYIKPFMADIADKNWEKNYLPQYFNARLKIKNSHRLYAEA